MIVLGHLVIGKGQTYSKPSSVSFPHSARIPDTRAKPQLP